ncbi:MAG: type II toxin-antitoxin system VapC family toxin, partial [Acetobacteraceae bacterium]
MKISRDINVLVRAVLSDDPAQSHAVRKLLREASLIAVPLPCLCELVWVLQQGAKLGKDDVAPPGRSLMNAGNVVVYRPAAELGLAALEAGGDFADGAIAHKGLAGRRNIRVVRQDGRHPAVQTGRGHARPGLTRGTRLSRPMQAQRRLGSREFAPSSFFHDIGPESLENTREHAANDPVNANMSSPARFSWHSRPPSNRFLPEWRWDQPSTRGHSQMPTRQSAASAAFSVALGRIAADALAGSG